MSSVKNGKKKDIKIILLGILMMWVLVCCLDWSFIVMNLRGF